MARRLSFDDSALYCTWARQDLERDAARPPFVSGDMSPERPRAPSPESMFRYSSGRSPSPRWTLLPSPLQQLETISVDLWDIKHRHPHPRPSRSSVRSVSVSSTTSEDSLSSLISDLDQSIASWTSDSSSESTRTLRKRNSPRRESLRDIRTKQSEWQLQQAYEKSLLAYLDDSMLGVFRPDPLRARPTI